MFHGVLFVAHRVLNTGPLLIPVLGQIGMVLVLWDIPILVDEYGTGQRRRRRRRKMKRRGRRRMQKEVKEEEAKRRRW